MMVQFEGNHFKRMGTLMAMLGVKKRAAAEKQKKTKDVQNPTSYTAPPLPWVSSTHDTCAITSSRTCKHSCRVWVVIVRLLWILHLHTFRKLCCKAFWFEICDDTRWPNHVHSIH